MVNKSLGVLLVVFAVLESIDSQTLPANPCPNLFRYFQNNGIIYGRMEFSNDFSGYYQLTVNMSVAAYLTNNENIRLELRTSANELAAGRSVVYHVYFPIQNVIPKPTRIEFNRRVYCAGPQEELLPGRGVTNMWATTFYRITGPILRPPRPNSANDVEIDLVPEFSIPAQPSTIPFRPVTQSPEVSTQTPFTSPSNPSFGTPRPSPSSSGSTETNLIDRNPTVDEQCGISSVNTQQLVVNGDRIEDGQYPWMVAIMYRQNSDYKYRCTGSLVSNRHVVTAGHCVQFFKAQLIPIEDLLLVFGKNNIRNWANGAVIRDVQKMSAHPDYKQNQGDGDIAVLTMDKSISFQRNIRPICLWQDEEDLDLIVGKEGTVVGWGMDESGKDFVTEAKKINLPIVSQVTCLRSDPGFANITSSRTFCAASVGNRNGSGPCTGDSGAGFMLNQNGKWTLRGVVSTALKDSGTCDLTNYFVFADAAKVKNWLREVMS